MLLAIRTTPWSGGSAPDLSNIVIASCYSDHPSIITNVSYRKEFMLIY